MASIFNQYSLLWVVIVLLAIVGFFLFRRKHHLPEIIAFLVICGGLAVAWFALRPTQSPMAGAAADVQARIGAGKPVLLEFQSPY
jgi:LPXTG-motif cell wall-anchored protein